MRVDLFGAAAVGIGTESGAARSAAGSRSAAASLPEDTASLSSDSFSVPSLASQALATAASRGAKVEALRQAVAGAAYKLDPELIAEAMHSHGA